MDSLVTVVAALCGLLVTVLLGYPFIPFLKRLKFGQTILEEGPSWHKSKEGTPTMGGVFMMIAFVVAMIAAFAVSAITGGKLTEQSGNLLYVLSGMGLALGMGFIGFFDDFIKVAKKRNLGLTAMQKTFLQMGVSAAYLMTLYLGGMRSTFIPFVGYINVGSGLGLIFWPIMLFFVYGFVNAVNLTDGIDGLASSVTMLVCCFFMIIAGVLGFSGMNALAAAAAGVCTGFLVWNMHPAKVFMGDTGSMFLGGVVVGLSFGIKCPVILIFAGILYLLEAFSVMIQVAYYKKTKKRLFKMSPIHHHYEMCGWKEEKIVLVFSLITAIGCGVAAFFILI